MRMVAVNGSPTPSVTGRRFASGGTDFAIARCAAASSV